LELSADLRERQQQLLRAAVPELCQRIAWIERLPQTFVGAMIANEVLDSMPVHLVVWRRNGLYERGVAVANDRFVWEDRRLASGPLFELASAIDAPPDYLSEVNLVARGFVKSLGQVLHRGAILLIDYGFAAREYYHPQRNQGTLMCHYRHRAHTDPFYAPGLQDVTAHVDFSALAQAGAEAGLEVLGYTRQANFLIDCGITELLSEIDAADSPRYLPLANQLQRLLSPNEMGDLYKVLALGRGIEVALQGFRNVGSAMI
jgi:SAM-dependent MidA family methyltransferase